MGGAEPSLQLFMQHGLKRNARATHPPKNVEGTQQAGYFTLYTARQVCTCIHPPPCIPTCKIARADQLEDATRQLAAEFLVTLCEAREKAPGMMRKLPNFVPNLFEVRKGLRAVHWGKAVRVATRFGLAMHVCVGGQSFQALPFPT